jgi:LuxR family maltose regulon positive regulatory protein
MEKVGANHLLLKILTEEAIIVDTQGDEKKAFTLLQRALQLAEPEGYIRVFISKGAPMKQMLRKALKAGYYSDFVSRLLGEYHKTSGTSPTMAIHPNPRASQKISGPHLIEPLSEREIQVLRLLDSALTSTEIGRELYVSVNTIRTHIRNIYAKLGVNRRGDAVRRAKESNLI